MPTPKELSALPHLIKIGEVLEGLTRDIQDQALRASLPETRAELVADRLALTAQYLDYVRLVQQNRWAETGRDELTARVGYALGYLEKADGRDHGPLHLHHVIDETARALLGPAYPAWVADRTDWYEGTRDEEPV